MERDCWDIDFEFETWLSCTGKLPNFGRGDIMTLHPMHSACLEIMTVDRNMAVECGSWGVIVFVCATNEAC